MNSHDNERERTISAIIRSAFRYRLTKKTEQRIEQMLVDDNFANEKNKALLKEWENIKSNKQRRGISDYRELIAIKRKLGIKAGRKRQVALAAFAIILPLIALIGGGYLYFNQDNRIPQSHSLTLTADNGQVEYVTLPDSSKVWINRKTTIEYFDDNHRREIKLDGEAYFEVTKDADRPFVVNAGDVSVEVLGTVFTVEAYKESEKAIITLNEGKIRATTSIDSHTQGHLLQPGDQLAIDKRQRTIERHSLTNTELTRNSAWIYGQIICNMMTIEEILQEINRNFKYTIEIDPAIRLSQERFTVQFLSSDSPEFMMDVLKMMIGGFDYTVEGNEKIRITKNTRGK